jgi:hypothetical protein
VICHIEGVTKIYQSAKLNACYFRVAYKIKSETKVSNDNVGNFIFSRYIHAMNFSWHEKICKKIR